MEQFDHKIPIFFTRKHYAFAFVVFLIWSYLVLSRDHILGCPHSHGIMYDTRIHLLTLFAYMCSHAVLIHQVERLNTPYEFAVSKMGSVLLTLRRLKFYLVVRIGIVCMWLFIVFYDNAEETYLPVFFLILHLILVIVTIRKIITAVQNDNSKLGERDKLKLGNRFYVAGTVEVACSIIWLAFNIADVHLCHEWYEWKVKW